jgi:hypothetical protein
MNLTRLNTLLLPRPSQARHQIAQKPAKTTHLK